ncbi:expressed unknown protein [Seminavis robusta]|uniref:Methyltransferase domain-containing protein n=1 Tax=Seminavis robusta TaxID=568900 RepID=A0A9N8EDR0_9STRA|nr:expressed unknown protein [Seminavis robusta]|eukprot:Sro847_g210290.1 n/a (348) ;mRNA; f:14800-15843
MADSNSNIAIIEDTSSATNSTPSIRASSRKNRVYVFRDFLLKTYGNHNNGSADCLLKPGAVMLDVAGGKGDLSWLLLNADGIESIVLDPRSLASANHLIRSVHWLEEHPKEAKLRAVPSRLTHQPLAALVPMIIEKRDQRRQGQIADRQDKEFLEPRHLQLKLDTALVEAIRQSIQEESVAATNRQHCPSTWLRFWDANMKSNCGQQVTASEPCFLPESERHQEVDAEQTIQNASEAWGLLQRIQLIVGFHPDQATEACLDLAVLLKVPVAIVPCCVFPSEFPDRRLEIEQENYDGAVTRTTTRVRDYHQLLLYLQQKQPKLRKDTLAFHQTETSRNIVLYALPEEI